MPTTLAERADVNQKLQGIKEDLHKNRAKTRMQFGALLGEILDNTVSIDGATFRLDPDGFSKKLAYEAMKTMPDVELRAWLADARDDWEDLDREDNFDLWSTMGSLIQWAEHLLHREVTGEDIDHTPAPQRVHDDGTVTYTEEVKGTEYGWPYHVAANPSGPRTRPSTP